MKARPILFNAEMVRALLDGRKTQDRRPVKPQPAANAMLQRYAGAETGFASFRPSNPRGWVCNGAITCPFGQRGDLLWVRETWEPIHVISVGEYGGPPYEADAWYGPVPKKWRPGLAADYRADDDADERKWRPSTSMPRWASRLTLRITDVRVQRIQEITLGDEAEEGWPENPDKWSPELFDRRHQWFVDLWNDTYGTWNENPWVWALTFDVLHQNVDELLRDAA